MHLVKKNIQSNIGHKLNVIVGICGMIIGILLVPFVFQRYLAVSLILGQEASALKVTCIIFFIISTLFILFRKKISPNVGLLYFSCLCLVGLELLVRLIFHYHAHNATKEEMGKACNRTYPQYTAYTGHPFTAFTGRPSTALEGNEAVGNLRAFNNLGFVGEDFQYARKHGQVRIAAIGGSTTVSGYPGLMESWMNGQEGTDSEKYEVLNFGMTYWTSAHSVVNFILNVVAFKPDYVIIHQAWNDEKPRNSPPEYFRTDYSHALMYYHEPEIYDKILLRASLLYRYVKLKYFDPTPDWALLGTSTAIEQRPTTNLDYSNLDELIPYTRNIQTIMREAAANDIKVVLTTMPYSTDPDIRFAYSALHIKQCNELLRKMKSNNVIFVDLDSMMTGRMNSMFKDLGHLQPEGRQFKAEQIGNAILKDIHSMATQQDSLLVIQ